VKQLIAVVVLSCAVVAAPTLRAEDARLEAVQSPARQIPLKVQLVVSRYQGEKKVSSLPYTIAVVANDGDKTSLRMGVDVPVPTTVFSGPKDGPANIPMTSYGYRSVGTNIDCGARTIDDGLFRLDIAIEDSSIFVQDKESTAGRMPNTPSFRKFTSTFNLLLRDGQTVQHTSATDPVSGEVLRVDVTLNVLK
jgi:hypothetical protein